MGTPEWLGILEKARAQAAKKLDLGNCGLTEMPEELFANEAFCAGLISMSFGGYFMRHDDKQESSLNSGTPNSISVIHPKISLCNNLVELSLYKNDIQKIEHLEKLTQLKILDLGTNKIETIENLQTLKQLEVLRISSNVIKKIGGLDELSSLRFLYLGWNKLEKIEKLDQLVNLESLYIGHNKIKDISSLSSLQKLKLFFADSNKIDNCSSLADMPNLEFINLSNNQIHDIYPLLGHIKKGRRVGNRTFEGNIQLEKNPLTNPTAEIVARGNEHIINYFAQTEADDTVEINETKLLILGAGGVGKTTLALKLQDPDLPMPELKDTTVGINISVNYLPVTVNDKEYKLHIWDFGGQDVYNSTHQFFLTRRSLYVLMEDGREQKNVLSYWLQAQELLAEESPILLVQNLKAGSRKEIDIGSYKKNFRNLKDYREADLSVKAQILPVWTALKAQLMQMPHFTEKLPRKWVDIKMEVEKLSKKHDHVSLNKFREICSDNNITDTNRQDKLLLFLHDLGIVLNFKDIPELRRLVVIKPQWATDAVYKILDHTKQQNKQGYFTCAFKGSSVAAFFFLSVYFSILSFNILFSSAC